MEFIELADLYAQKFKISWNQSAVTIAHLVLQYPGGVTNNIVESNFQILKQKLESVSLGDSFVKDIQNSNWSNFYKNERYSNKKNNVYEGSLSINDHGRNLENMEMVTLESGKDSTECLYFIPEAWKINLSFLSNFMIPKRKIRFSDSPVIISKVQSNTAKIVVKFLPSAAALFILDPFTNQSDADFLTSVECSYLFKDIACAENLSVLVQILEIYPIVGDRLEIAIVDSSNAKSTLVLWTSQTLISILVKEDDFLLICNPYVDLAEENTCLQVGSKTTLFLVHPYPKNGNGNGTKDPLAPAAKGTSWNCSTFQKKFPAFSLKSVKQLPEESVEKRITTKNIPSFEREDITIYGRLIKMVSAETDRGDRKLGIRLQDEVGFTDITINGNLVYSVASCEAGDFLLLTNLSTIRQYNGSYLLLASESAKMFNICKMIGLPSSSSLHQLTLIGEAIKLKLDFFYCRAFIIDSVLLSEVALHSKCKSKVDIDDGIAFCSSCLTFVDDVVSMNLYVLVLDDGTGQIKVEASENIILQLHALSKAKYISQHHFGIVNFGNIMKVSLYCANPPIEAIARLSLKK